MPKVGEGLSVDNLYPADQAFDYRLQGKSAPIALFSNREFPRVNPD